MPWYELSLAESYWQPIVAATEPTNPSSFTLAVVGVGTFLCYRILARPGHGRRRLLEMAQPDATTQANVATTEAAAEERRVA